MPTYFVVNATITDQSKLDAYLAAVPAYQEVIGLRMAGTKGFGVVAEGYAP
jgi:hypothetical protein